MKSRSVTINGSGQGASWQVVLRLNGMSTLVGNFLSSPRAWEKRNSRGDGRERQGRKRNRNEIEETRESVKPKDAPQRCTIVRGLC